MECKNTAHTSTLLLVEAEVTLLGRCGLPSSTMLTRGSLITLGITMQHVIA